MAYTGRKKILVNTESITSENIIKYLKEAINTHEKNKREENYLYEYYKGNQPILNREKKIRPTINNKIVVNKANEIVSFKTGYLLYSPIQYASKSNEQSDEISTLNSYMDIKNKVTIDKEVVDYMHICGVGVKILLQSDDGDDIPFDMYSADPRNTFVIYSAKLIGEPPIMGVRHYIDVDSTGVLKTNVYECYTKDMYYKIREEQIVQQAGNALKQIPIIEYPLNNARIGAFEIVLSLLDAINNVQSNRNDGIEQFVQSLLLFHNVDIDTEKVETLNEIGAIKFRDINQSLQGEIKYLVSQLDQTNTQTLVDDLVDSVLAIVGMPPTKNNGSSAETGMATIMQDGWYLAEARAKDTENLFKASERQLLKLVTYICNNTSDLKLDYKDIDIKFTRKNYENIQSKVQVLIAMLQNEKIAPRLAFATANLFPDSEGAWLESKEYIAQQANEQGKEVNAIQTDTKADPKN
jgi:SPP1 family phage portal protein|nr:MAG TPA: Portal [Caudoviricetes sp.]